jgi:hypothetical protein
MTSTKSRTQHDIVSEYLNGHQPVGLVEHLLLHEAVLLLLPLLSALLLLSALAGNLGALLGSFGDFVSKHGCSTSASRARRSVKLQL